MITHLLLGLICTSLVVFGALVEPESEDCPANCIHYDFNANTTVMFDTKGKGRLGNHMTVYSMMFGLKQYFGFQVFILQDLLDNLRYYFKGSFNDVKPLDTLCMESFPWEYHMYGLLPLNKSGLTGEAFEIPWNTRLLGGNLNGIMKIDVFLEPIESEIRQMFTMQDKFTDKAQERLRNLADKYKENYLKKGKKKSKKKIENEALTFVGVHIRKDDFWVLEHKYRMPRLNPSYYLKAMDLFLDKFKHPIFVVLTDDLEWVRNNIIRRAGKIHISIVTSHDGNLKDRDEVGYDFATLVSCNHTILSYGTFSSWAGILSPGKRIIPAMILDQVISKANNPLNKGKNDLPPFALSDYKLKYQT